MNGNFHNCGMIQRQERLSKAEMFHDIEGSLVILRDVTIK